MFKLIAVLGNLGYLGFIIFMIIDQGFPRKDDQAWLLTGVVIVILCSLISILKPPKTEGDENIFALWLKVKKANLKKQLEE